MTTPREEAVALVRRIRQRVQDGEVHLAEVGKLLFDKFDQDNVATLLDAIEASALIAEPVPSKEMVERVARAIAASDNQERIGQPVGTRFERYARAALAALAAIPHDDLNALLIELGREHRELFSADTGEWLARAEKHGEEYSVRGPTPIEAARQLQQRIADNG